MVRPPRKLKVEVAGSEFVRRSFDAKSVSGFRRRLGLAFLIEREKL